MIDAMIQTNTVTSPKGDQRGAFARRAISLIWQALGIDLQSSFLRDLRAAKSWRTKATGADLYRQLPIVRQALLPPQ